LFACVHPDRHHGTHRPEALQFSEAFALLKDRQVFNAAIKEFQRQRRPGSARTTHQSKEEETLRLRFQELQRRNAMLMGEEKKLRERVQHLEQVNTILRQSVQKYEESHGRVPPYRG
jgi:chromosome segregation ATPase